MLDAFGVASEEEAEPVMRAYCSAAQRALTVIDAFYTRANLHFPDKA